MVRTTPLGRYKLTAVIEDYPRQKGQKRRGKVYAALPDGTAVAGSRTVHVLSGSRLYKAFHHIQEMCDNNVYDTLVEKMKETANA